MKFKFSKTVQRLLVVGVVAVVVSACGGGGGGGGATTAADPTTLSGVVAVGRPYPAGAIITVTDANAPAQTATVTLAGSDGSYTLTLPAGFKAPFVLVASADDEETLVSVAATTASGTANITPLTNLIAAGLSPSGDPTKLASEVSAGSATVSTATVAAKVAEVQTLIRTVTTAVGGDAATANPLSGTFAANGKGMDRVLDSIKISIVPQNATTSQVQIAIKADDAATAAPVFLALGNNAPTNLGATALPAVTEAALPASGVGAEIPALLARLGACFNLPRATRTNGTAQNIGTTITSDTCKGLFWNNDPVTYKENSYTVGNQTSGSTSAFSGIFTNADTATLVFDQGTFQYKNLAGNSVFTARWTATFPCSNDITQTCSNTDIGIYTAKADANGKLFLFGNQSQFDLAVDGRVELRDFPHADFKKYSYLNAGYSLWVNSKHNFGKVVITTPNNKSITLKQIPGGGYSYMGIAKGNGSSTLCTNSAPTNCIASTAVLRMSAEYLDITTTSSSDSGNSTNHPRDVDGALVWSYNNGWVNWTDADIAAIPDQGTWTFAMYTNAADSTAAYTEKRRTLNRAPTLAEAKKIIWPTLSTALRTKLVSDTTSTGGFKLTTAAPIYVTSDMTSTGGDGWAIPTGAWSPYSVKVFGGYYNAMPATTKIGFDDESTVRSSMRKTAIYCSGSDGHCTGSNFKPYIDGNTNFSGFSQLQLNGRDKRRLLNTVSINFRKT